MAMVDHAPHQPTAVLKSVSVNRVQPDLNLLHQARNTETRLDSHGTGETLPPRQRIPDQRVAGWHASLPRRSWRRAPLVARHAPPRISTYIHQSHTHTLCMTVGAVLLHTVLPCNTCWQTAWGVCRETRQKTGTACHSVPALKQRPRFTIQVTNQTPSSARDAMYAFEHSASATECFNVSFIH